MNDDRKYKISNIIYYIIYNIMYGIIYNNKFVKNFHSFCSKNRNLNHQAYISFEEKNKY